MKRDINKLVATYSIVGFDPETEELGIAVQSRFLGVGAVVPWAKAGVGAVATQSFANTTFGVKGLELMESGLSVEETLEELVKNDEGKGLRQVGIVDAKGRSASFTGEDCYDWAGGIAGENFAAQGNILASEEVVTQMAETFERTKGEPLAERLLKALEKGQEAGGDRRGMQSAALLVVKEGAGYGGFNDRAVDLRVDDHKEPIKELIRIYRLHQLYFTSPKDGEIVAITGEVREGLVDGLLKLGYLEDKGRHEDKEVYDALRKYIHTENFEAREQEDGKIDLKVYEYLRAQTGL